MSTEFHYGFLFPNEVLRNWIFPTFRKNLLNPHLVTTLFRLMLHLPAVRSYEKLVIKQKHAARCVNSNATVIRLQSYIPFATKQMLRSIPCQKADANSQAHSQNDKGHYSIKKYGS